MALGRDSVIVKHLVGEDGADGVGLYFEVGGGRGTAGREGRLGGGSARDRRGGMWGRDIRVEMERVHRTWLREAREGGTGTKGREIDQVLKIWGGKRRTRKKDNKIKK